jgi:hypothetical protein
MFIDSIVPKWRIWNAGPRADAASLLAPFFEQAAYNAVQSEAPATRLHMADIVAVPEGCSVVVNQQRISGPLMFPLCLLDAEFYSKNPEKLFTFYVLEKCLRITWLFLFEDARVPFVSGKWLFTAEGIERAPQLDRDDAPVVEGPIQTIDFDNVADAEPADLGHRIRLKE